MRGIDASDERSLNDWFLSFYPELRDMAHRKRGPSDQACTTSIVHEAYERLSRAEPDRIRDRALFMYLASRAIRSILVDNARRSRSMKGGGGLRQVEFNEERLVSTERAEDVLALEQLMRQLEQLDRRLAAVVTCRVFGGLNVEETALAVRASPATVKRDWRLARNWLFQTLALTERSK